MNKTANPLTDTIVEELLRESCPQVGSMGIHIEDDGSCIHCGANLEEENNE